MPYANYEDEIKWRENNRKWYQTPEERIKQKARRIKYINKKLENLPDRYEYDYDKKKKCYMRYHWCRNIGRVYKLRESDFERTWEKYTTTTHCELCNISLKKVKKNMEHNHLTGYFRFVACQRCNGYLRYVDENFQEVMKQIR